VIDDLRPRETAGSVLAQSDNGSFGTGW